MIINATSAGISNNVPLIVPSDIFHEKIICYDISYSNEDTIFIKLCKKLGVKKVYNGIGMLVNQAAHSFFLWTNIFPNVNHVLSSLKN